MNEKSNYIDIYTDGACSNNPGVGGWGAVLLYKNNKKEIFGSQKDTTNNRMELKAVIEALGHIKSTSIKIRVFTDSVYVKDGISKWIESWKNNGWKNSNKKPIKNIDLWKELDEVSKKFIIEWIWVKGHNGNQYNEIADSLARKGCELLLK